MKQSYNKNISINRTTEDMESFLNNSSFFLLLCSMAFYWIRAFFHFSIFSFFGKLTISSAHLIMFFLLIFRGIGENHFPLSNQVIKKVYHEIYHRIVFY